jgi:hypothetical protein
MSLFDLQKLLLLLLLLLLILQLLLLDLLLLLLDLELQLVYKMPKILKFNSTGGKLS